MTTLGDAFWCELRFKARPVATCFHLVERGYCEFDHSGDLFLAFPRADCLTRGNPEFLHQICLGPPNLAPPLPQFSAGHGPPRPQRQVSSPPVPERPLCPNL